jgi:hypothetical protein
MTGIGEEFRPDEAQSFQIALNSRKLPIFPRMRKTAVDDDVCDEADVDRILAEHDGGGTVETIIEILARIFEAFPRVAPAIQALV